jgi:glutathione S-transferase
LRKLSIRNRRIGLRRLQHHPDPQSPPEIRMKLYYAANACSLASHIVAIEAGIVLELERIDIRTTPHRTEDGHVYAAIAAKDYVPALRLDDGELLTEGIAISLYLADRAPDAGLVPAVGTPDWYRLLEWMNFISSELHKSFSPWLFHPEVGAAAQDYARSRIAVRFALVDAHLSDREFLLGDRFTIADAYLFVIADWSRPLRIDLSLYPALAAYLERIRARDSVREALAREQARLAA